MRRGTLFCQIDGLGSAEFDRALEKGELPFLAARLKGRNLVRRRFYSGLPSTTPAVQGELFYGKPLAVPAFCYFDRDDGEMVKLYDSARAARVQGRLAPEGTGLLEKGSAYFDIYDGGAEEARFCTSRLGSVLPRFGPPDRLLLFVRNFASWVRTFVLVILECLLALWDSLRGAWGLGRLGRELAFVPLRVMISILFRELAVIGARADLRRGLERVHVNFLGYDEQAHRRGPSSAFAHWTLRGMDDSIRRLWEAAEAADTSYRLIVYSDHGQEDVLPYEIVHGRGVDRVVAEVLREDDGGKGESFARRLGIQGRRSVLLGGRFWQDLLHRVDGRLEKVDRTRAIVAVLGPLGHLYLPPGAPVDRALARALVDSAGIPMVLRPRRGGGIHVDFEGGSLRLPEDGDAAGDLGLGTCPDLLQDLVALCHHPHAGDLIISGWREEGALSFSLERGAHGGPGPHETEGFLLVPPRLSRALGSADWLRPGELYRALRREEEGSVRDETGAVGGGHP